MPGLVGIAAPSAAIEASARLTRMLRPMERGGRLVTERTPASASGWAFGRVHLNVLHREPQIEAGASLNVLVQGDIVNLTELRALVGVPGTASAATVVRELYRRFADGLASRLKGSFCLAIIDQGAQQLRLVTDRFGSYPLYWTHQPGQCAFASEARALVPILPKLTLNPLALNDLFQFGFPTGDRTLAEGVHLLPPCAVLTYDAGRDAVSIARYASWAPAFATTDITKPQYLDAVTGAFEQSMQRAAEGTHRFGLSLSGGLDTRVILSGLDRMHITPVTSTLGGRGCADEVIGEQLAKMAGTEHQFVPLEESYLADLEAMAGRMTSLTDGLYTSDGFTEILALRAFESVKFDVLLRGHLGELAKAGTAYPFHTDAAVFEMQSKPALLSHLLARQESLNQGSRSQGLFADAWKAAEDPGVAPASIAAFADADLSPPDLCSYIYLTEYHRRVTVPSLEIFRNIAEVRLPLADDDFVVNVLRGPSRWRNGVEIHQTIVRRLNPKFLKIRNPNTGAPAGAGPLQEFVLDKLNSVLRRLNVYGYRHYHAFDGWMRQALLDIVDKVLLTPQALDRRMVREQPLRQLIDRARQGDKSPDHVLQVLVLTELWLREVA